MQILTISDVGEGVYSRDTVFQEIRPGDGFKTRDFVKEKGVGGATAERLYRRKNIAKSHSTFKSPQRLVSGKLGLLCRALHATARAQCVRKVCLIFVWTRCYALCLAGLYLLLDLWTMRYYIAAFAQRRDHLIIDFIFRAWCMTVQTSISYAVRFPFPRASGSTSFCLQSAMVHSVSSDDPFAT